MFDKTTLYSSGVGDRCGDEATGYRAVLQQYGGRWLTWTQTKNAMKFIVSEDDVEDWRPPGRQEEAF